MIAFVDVVLQAEVDEVFEVFQSGMGSAGEGVDGLDGAIKVFESGGDVVGKG